jgi:lysozyme
MNISGEGKSLIKKFEGCELESYKCSGGVWTCGWGSTKDVKEGDVWSQAYADERFDGDIEEFENYVNDLVKVPLMQHQFDALVAWTYNLGPSSLKKSTLLKKLNAEDYDAVPCEIRRWNKAGGKVLDGLVRRRDAEAMLFVGNPDWHTI